MEASAERYGRRIRVGTQYRTRELPIPGAYWSRTGGYWTLGLSMDNCRALREVFGSGLRIGPNLNAWASRERAAELSQAELGRALDGIDLLRVPDRYPALAERMSSRSYQPAAARFVAEGRSVLVADTPGLGKTTEAIAGVIESGVPGPYLVVAPKTALETVWERELARWVPDAYIMPLRAGRPARTRALDAALDNAFDLSNTWVLVNIEMVRTQSWWLCPECDREYKVSDRPKAQIVLCGHNIKRVKTIHHHEYPRLFAGEWGAVIMDESQRSLIRRSGTPTLTRNGARLLQTREEGLRIALSGTPMRGKPQRLFGTLQWLRPEVYTSFWTWAALYWEVLESGYRGSLNIGVFRKDRQRAFDAALSAIMVRRTKAEVSPELPVKQYMGSLLDPTDEDSPTAVWLEPDPLQLKAYKEMLANGSAYVEGGMVNTIGVLAEWTRLKQFATSYGRLEGRTFRPSLPSNKYDWLVQFLLERNIIDPDDEATGKVVVVSQFTDILRTFANQLAKDYDLRWAAITGTVTGRKRAQAEDTFNDPRSGVNVMWLNTTAGGVSITLDAADDMVFLDETFVPDDQEQAEDRINNRRPEEKVVARRYWYLKTLGTIEEAIARTNLSLDKDMKAVLDGRRGVAYVREVIHQMRE